MLLCRVDVVVQRTDIHGWTPFHGGAAEGRMEIVEIAVEVFLGSDPTVVVTSGCSCLRYAASDDIVEIVDSFLTEGLVPTRTKPPRELMDRQAKTTRPADKKTRHRHEPRSLSAPGSLSRAPGIEIGSFLSRVVNLGEVHGGDGGRDDDDFILRSVGCL